MRKLTVLVLCMTIGMVLANDPVKDLKPYAVKKTEITNVSPFCISVAKGDYDMVKKMIELGTEVNSFSGGMTPLMYAARYNRIEMIKLLVANGAKISKKDSNGNAAIQYAEWSGANEAKAVLKELRQK